MFPDWLGKRVAVTNQNSARSLSQASGMLVTWVVEAGRSKFGAISGGALKPSK